jgi:hypothetical protein
MSAGKRDFHLVFDLTACPAWMAEDPEMIAVWAEVDATPLRWGNLHVAAFLIDQEQIPLRLCPEPVCEIARTLATDAAAGRIFDRDRNRWWMYRSWAEPGLSVIDALDAAASIVGCTPFAGTPRGLGARDVLRMIESHIVSVEGQPHRLPKEDDLRDMWDLRWGGERETES